MKIAAIIAAAGIGKRMGVNLPKQYLEIGGRPIICHTLDRFRDFKELSDVIIVVEPGREASFKSEILERYEYPKKWSVAGGGKVRQESVANGLKLVAPGTDIVLVHDGVRPFITPAELALSAETALRDGACIIASPIKETVKRIGTDGNIRDTIDRSNLWGAKTPQAFTVSLLREAMQAAFRDNFVGTDEASLVERIGKKVKIIEGNSRNIKITTQEDLIIAEALLKEWPSSIGERR